MARERLAVLLHFAETRSPKPGNTPEGVPVRFWGVGFSVLGFAVVLAAAAQTAVVVSGQRVPGTLDPPNSVVALFFTFDTAADVTAETVIDTEQDGADLSTLPAVVRPGVYSFEGVTYRLAREGLYRIVDYRHDNARQVAVFDGDVPRLMSSFSWMVVHGQRDEHIPLAEQAEQIMARKLSLDCGPVTALVVKLLARVGVEARPVVFQSADWETESVFGNNHAMPEVLVKGQWALFDVDSNVYFTYRDRFVSALDFVTHEVTVNDLTIHKLAGDDRFNLDDYAWVHRGDAVDLPDYSFVFDYVYSDIRLFYRRIIQVPIFGSEFTGARHRAVIEAYRPDYRYVPKADLISRYYADDVR